MNKTITVPGGHNLEIGDTVIVAGNEAWNAGVAWAKSIHEPKLVEPHIYEYPSDIFVVFDPTDGGSGIIGAYRSLVEAQLALAMVTAFPE